MTTPMHQATAEDLVARLRAAGRDVEIVAFDDGTEAFAMVVARGRSARRLQILATDLHQEQATQLRLPL